MEPDHPFFCNQVKRLKKKKNLEPIFWLAYSILKAKKEKRAESQIAFTFPILNMYAFTLALRDQDLLV